MPVGDSARGHAGRAARGTPGGVRTIFNLAPAQTNLPDELYGLSDIFCPNESETELLTGQRVSTLTECEAAARVLLKL